MKKGIFLVLVLAVIIAGGAFAQDANSHNNWASGEIGLLGAGLRYERMLNDQWSVGGNVFFNSFFFFFNSIGVEAFGRYYPWGANFYAEVGLGFGTVTGDVEIDYTYAGKTYTADYLGTTSGVMISPGVGWKIDVGNPGSFYLNPSIVMPIVFGKIDGYVGYGNTKVGDKFDIGWNFKAALGMGYAF